MRRAVTEHAPDLANLRHGQRAMAAVHLLARLDGVPAGCGMSAIFPGQENAPFLWADATVLAARRGRGIGEAILREVSRRGRGLGKEGLQLEVREDDDYSVRFVERRGYREIERQKEVMLDLGELSGPPAVQPPQGVEIVSRPERPDLERAQYGLELEAGRDIPGLDGEIEQSFEQWRSFAIERPGSAPS